LRKWVQEEVQRGQVTVRVSFEAAQTSFLLPALKNLKTKWEQLAKGLGYAPSVVDFQFLTEQMERLPLEASPVKAELKKTVSDALKEFMAMRKKEGEALVKDLEQRIALIKSVLKKIEKKAPLALERHRKKLQDKVKALADDERILREAVIVAEKADVTEEITRLYSHLAQFTDLLGEKEKAVGRTLDFLTQEMGREINTLSAKAAESDMFKMAVLIRAEIEKIREQVQNIE
jgi:uncharacterized protein (TIGR00255 family)